MYAVRKVAKQVVRVRRPRARSTGNWELPLTAQESITSTGSPRVCQRGEMPRPGSVDAAIRP